MRGIFYISIDWFFLLAYLVVIFAILPFSVYIVQNITESSPSTSFPVTLSVYAVIGIIGIALAIYVIATNKRYKIPRLLALIVILFIGLSCLADMEDFQDKLHIIVYGILAFLLFRVLRFYNPTTALYLWCAIFVGIAGCADEYVQRFIPERDFSLLDIKTDVFTGILSELAIMLVICPRLEKWRLKMSFYKKKLHDRQKWIEDYRMRRNA
ncbi:MAG: VanZ family protein [Candidatus Scalinduaceae bacterium]